MPCMLTRLTSIAFQELRQKPQGGQYCELCMSDERIAVNMPKRSRMPAMVRGVGQSRPYLRQCCHWVHYDFFVVWTGWTERDITDPTPYTLHIPWNQDKSKARHGAAYRYPTQNCAYFAPCLFSLSFAVCWFVGGSVLAALTTAASSSSPNPTSMLWWRSLYFAYFPVASY